MAPGLDDGVARTVLEMPPQLPRPRTATTRLRLAPARPPSRPHSVTACRGVACGCPARRPLSAREAPAASWTQRGTELWSSRAILAITAARLAKVGLEPEEQRPAEMPTEGELRRWGGELRRKARIHRDEMARIGPADKEELAVHRAAERRRNAFEASRKGEPAKELKRLRADLEASSYLLTARRRLGKVEPELQAARACQMFGAYQERSSPKTKSNPEELLPEVSVSSEASDMDDGLMPLSQQLQMDMEDVRLGKSVFERFQDNAGCLNAGEFETAALELLHAQEPRRPPTSAAAAASRLSELGSQLPGRVEGRRGLSLQAFLTWYARGLADGPSIIEKERWSELAERHGTCPSFILQLKQNFDACADVSGQVRLEDFARLMQRVLRVPPQQEVPFNRAQHFWAELAGSTGSVSFESFLQWWVRYFTEELPEGEAPFEAFYGSVRRLGSQRLDPRVPFTRVELEGRSSAEDLGSAERVLHERRSI